VLAMSAMPAEEGWGKEGCLDLPTILFGRLQAVPHTVAFTSLLWVSPTKYLIFMSDLKFSSLICGLGGSVETIDGTTLIEQNWMERLGLPGQKSSG
jgi:hypothetical protein